MAKHARRKWWNQAETQADRQQRARYFDKLLAKYSPFQIRELLVELAKMPDFIPARWLSQQDIWQTPLTGLLQIGQVPWFYFEDIVEDNWSVTVKVWHGVPMAALGEAFSFEKTVTGLVYKSYRQYKVS